MEHLYGNWERTVHWFGWRKAPANHSGVPGRLAVTSVGAAPAPVRLRRHLVLGQPAAGQDLAQPQYHPGLAEQVGVPATGWQLHLRGLRRELLRGAGRPADPVQPAQPDPGHGGELLLVLRVGNLDHDRRLAV